MHKALAEMLHVYDLSGC